MSVKMQTTKEAAKLIVEQAFSETPLKIAKDHLAATNSEMPRANLTLAETACLAEAVISLSADKERLTEEGNYMEASINMLRSDVAEQSKQIAKLTEENRKLKWEYEIFVSGVQALNCYSKEQTKALEGARVIFTSLVGQGISSVSMRSWLAKHGTKEWMNLLGVLEQELHSLD